MTLFAGRVRRNLVRALRRDMRLLLPAEAGVPDGMGVAFFVTNVQRGGPSTKKEQYDTSVRLVNGLAIRLGGVAWPEASVMQEPLRATIYTAREDVTADQVYAIAARYAQGLAPARPGCLVSAPWR
jgi:hypothetical protein